MILKFRTETMSSPARSAPRLPALTAAVALLCPGMLWAAHPLATDDTGTLGTGGLQTEVSFTSTGCEHHGLDVDVGLALHAGVARSLDVGVALGAAVLPLAGWDPGVADPRVDVKWRIAPALALRLDLAPHLDPALGHDLGGLLVATREVGPWTLGANLGAYLHGLWSSQRRWLGLVSAAALRTMAEGLALGLEAWGSGNDGGLETVAALAALQWNVSRAGTLSFGVGPTWDGAGTGSWAASLGFTSDLGGPPD